VAEVTELTGVSKATLYWR